MKARSDCSICYALDIFGDKWTLLILRDMIFEGKSSFSEFRNSEEKIASNILTDRLKNLDAEGFLIKTASAANKAKFLYSLTDKAIDLLPVFVEIFAWGAKYNVIKQSTNPVYKKLVANKSKTITEYANGLKIKRDTALGS
ncbi:winged helix-turn-helix transcriptional regulator [Pedobacter hartonius]|uniref:Transcriptional regulator, HxlR family n=1 Tax=Pedobacter hartonius TaxID=425514 RepID=A0A1H4BN18_9SPHI|nr:helix-turn-helix domain-containing protein [Pedobacter hartonius]SEA49553.1 transcriptional regulator, HxlR family [Pedobacter hartonius]